MTGAKVKRREAVLAALDGAVPDSAAVNEGIAFLVASLRRGNTSDARNALFCLREGRRILVSPFRVTHYGARRNAEEGVTGSAELSSPTDDTPTIQAKFFDATDGAIVIAADGGFRWAWPEVASGLAAALRAIPGRVPRPVLCERCKRELCK